MNKTVTIILVTISLISCQNSYKCCKSAALLVPKQCYVPIYDKPYGIKIDSIINDTIKEDYALISIEEIKSKFAKIVSQGAIIDTIQKEGWIELEYIGINPAITSPLFLRKKVNKYSAISDTISEPYWGDLYPILKCNGQWLYIKTKENGKWKKGWMSPEDQCGNPYTTCN